MRPREQADFATYRANFFQLAPVGANLFMRDHFAHYFFFKLVKHRADFFFRIGIILCRKFFGKCLDDFRFNFVKCRLTRELVGISYHLVDFLCREFADCRVNFFCRHEQLDFLFLFADCRFDLVLEGDNLFNFLVPEKYCLKHNFFRQFLDARLNHHDRVARTRHD